MQYFNLLEEVRKCRDNLSAFRRKRNRCLDYTFGRQWNDIIEVDGRRITEYEYILNEGNVPLKNNLIRRIVRNVLGVFRDKLDDIMKETYGGELSKVAEANSLDELFTRSMEEFLISGMAVHRKRIGLHNGIKGQWTEMVSPADIFFNTDATDTRGNDIHMIGQIHRVDLNDWMKAFVKTPEDYKRARTIFNSGERKIKLIEIWRKEVLPFIIFHDREKGYIRRVRDVKDIKDERSVRSVRDKGLRKKWIVDEVWRYYFMCEDGSVICQGDSPYLHKNHPFVIKCYPFLDGEIQSLVADMIDQQRYTNRLITLYDWVIRASAKGVLLLPEGSVDPANLQNVADQWGRFNGVILYKGNINLPEPKQICGNVSNLGISELLEIQLKMLEDVSGVNGVLQGKSIGGNVSGELYNSQTINAMYSLQDLLSTYEIFIRDSAAKDRELMNQRLVLDSKFH